MRIEIDTGLLEQLKITADEFLFLEAERMGVLLEIELLASLQVDLDKVESLGLIKLIDETPEGADFPDVKIHLRDEYLKVVASDFDQMFAELIGAYPFKVGSVGDMRVLRAHDSKAKANDIARKRYRMAVGNNLPLHRKVLQLLDIQLTNMRGKLQYLPALEVWINKREWEKWEGTDKDEGDAEGRITTVLD
jgi:hypothetical protein